MRFTHRRSKKKLLFTKQRYYEVGGKSTKFLAYKLKKQQAKNNIYKIRDPHTRSTVVKTGNTKML